jgi:predicted N-acetyltransferase YhbS
MPIRLAKESDAESVATLLENLGYPATTAQVAGRVRAILLRDDYSILVADNDNALLGVGSVHVFPCLHSEPVALLTALVVDISARGTGLGRTLVTGLEDFAVMHRCERILATTANHRSGAHAFYEKLGFSFTGRRYVKQLPVYSPHQA